MTFNIFAIEYNSSEIINLKTDKLLNLILSLNTLGLINFKHLSKQYFSSTFVQNILATIDRFSEIAK